MGQSAKQIAEYASFQAFMNSYVREVEEGQFVQTETWRQQNPASPALTGAYMLEAVLPCQGIQLALEVTYRSLTGRHIFRRVLRQTESGWEAEEYLAVMLLLVQELHATRLSAFSCPHYDELLTRLMESYHTMTKYIEAWQTDEKEEEYCFLEAEQSLLYGHWLHPTPKSRQGMALWQQYAYAPEFGGAFQLHYFRVQAAYVQANAVDPAVKRELLQEEEGGIMIPMHPLQAQWLQHQPYIQRAVEAGIITYVGPWGPMFTATSSIRTVYNRSSPWMYKFSIPVKVTNSLRINRRHELQAGIAIARLLQRLDARQATSFQIIQDPAYITVDLPGKSETGFEVILRENPFTAGNDGDVMVIAALVQDPLPGEQSRLQQIILRQALREKRAAAAVSMDWFQQYWSCAVEPMLRLYEEHGIALEAHQQNSVLRLQDGYPGTYYYRDNQGYYLSQSYQAYLQALEPSLSEATELFYRDDIICGRFFYYLFGNQLFSLIHRFGADGLLSEERLVEWIVEQLKRLEQQFTGVGKEFVKKLLTAERLPYKANLLTRLYDVDELEAELEQAVYTSIVNPFIICKKEQHHAFIHSI